MAPYWSGTCVVRGMGVSDLCSRLGLTLAELADRAKLPVKELHALQCESAPMRQQHQQRLDCAQTILDELSGFMTPIEISHFLNSPIAELDNEVPLDCMFRDGGRVQVMRLIAERRHSQNGGSAECHSTSHQSQLQMSP